MKVESIRVIGLRCFRDTGNIELSPSVNVFVGENNTGKSTLLKSILAFQGFPFADDERPGSSASYHEMVVKIEPDTPVLSGMHRQDGRARLAGQIAGQTPNIRNEMPVSHMGQQGFFRNQRPDHVMVPFLAKRKGMGFDHTVNRDSQSRIPGTLYNLYSRIDEVSSTGHPNSREFQEALAQTVGVPIATRASANGKEAGFYFDRNKFVPLDRMGDGVAEIVALLVELCLEENKIFILEEPETNLHPTALKSLLQLVRTSVRRNQFIVATHSNIVVRELGSVTDAKVFRVFRQDEDYRSPSVVEEVQRSPSAHAALMRDLGYEFSDMGLYDAWLFLEEASAERIIRDILIPRYVPALLGRLRTFSAAGISNVTPRLSDFQRLVTFIHLEPVYQGRLWVRVDNDEPGRAVVATLKNTFGLDDAHCSTFSADAFEKYYPSQYQPRVAEILALENKNARRDAKQNLLLEVVAASANGSLMDEWRQSAAGVIDALSVIARELAQ